MAPKPTLEQTDIMETFVPGDKNLVVEAGAGCGKTSVLKMAARSVRKLRAAGRAGKAAGRAGRTWEPDHLAGKHQLAATAKAMCEEAQHTSQRQVGGTACGECWESAIRQDGVLGLFPQD